MADLRVSLGPLELRNPIDSWVGISTKLAHAGADMVELNFGCPNIGVMQKTLGKLSGDEEEVLGSIYPF